MNKYKVKCMTDLQLCYGNDDQTHENMLLRK